MKDSLDDIFLENKRKCRHPDCPTLEALELYAKGLYGQMDEKDFNNVEDALLSYECPFCKEYVRQREKAYMN